MFSWCKCPLPNSKNLVSGLSPSDGQKGVYFLTTFCGKVNRPNRLTQCCTQWAISELLFVSVSKWVLVLNYWKGNQFDLHKNTQLISIWMVVHQDSPWNWGTQQLGNGLFKSPGDNPLTPSNDKHVNSPHNFNEMTVRQLLRMKIINSLRPNQ